MIGHDILKNMLAPKKKDFMDNNDASTNCELYEKALNDYLDDQRKRGVRLLSAALFGYSGANNNAEAEKKMQLDIKFQACQMEKINKIESGIEYLKQKAKDVVQYKIVPIN